MNKDEKILSIIDNIYKATISGSLKWDIANSIFNNDTSHRYKSLSSDGITKFQCTVNLQKDLTLDKANGILNIENPNMVDDGLYMSVYNYPSIGPILDFIYKNHIKPNLKVINQDIVMDDILKGIDISDYRDRKIDSVLSDQKKESFFKKFFK